MTPSDHDPSEQPDLREIAARLERERPRPSAEFRGDLYERLATPRATRPRIAWRPRALVAAYGASGLLLMVVPAVGLAGLGPFAA
jgi:hypothetical protein